MFTNLFFYLFMGSVLLNIVFFFFILNHKNVTEYLLFQNSMKYLISAKMETIIKLTEKIYTILQPHFKPVNPNLVKFEIVNYLLFRLFYDKVADIPVKYQRNYFTSYLIVFAKYISNPTTNSFHREVKDRNELYMAIYHKFRKSDLPLRLDMVVLLLTFLQHTAKVKNENEITLPPSFFVNEKLFPENPGDKLGDIINNIIKKEFPV